MTLGRLGDPGSEIPVIRHDGRVFDLRPLTADIDGSFLSATASRVPTPPRPRASCPSLRAPPTCGSRRRWRGRARSCASA